MAICGWVRIPQQLRRELIKGLQDRAGEKERRG